MSNMGYYGSFGRRRRSPSPYRCRCRRGFRFRFRLRYGKRFSVQRLRARFMSVFRVLERLRRRYGLALKLFGWYGSKKNREGYFGSLERKGSSRVWLEPGDAQRSASMMTKTCGLRYVARSNTFQAEAIADCLEFIKGTYSTASVVGHGDDNGRYLRQGTEDDSVKSS